MSKEKQPWTVKEYYSPAGLECGEEFEYFILTDGSVVIYASDSNEDFDKCNMICAVLNAYSGRIWVDGTDQIIIKHQKEQIDTLTTALAAKDAEIERLKELLKEYFTAFATLSFLTTENKAAGVAQFTKEKWEEFKTANNL